MKEKPNFLQRNFSAAVLIAIYILFVIIHLIFEGFLLESQFYLIATIFPFIVLGIILDFFLRRNVTLGKGYILLAQLIPAFIFVMFGLSNIFNALGKDIIEIFKYLIWLFLTLPFFIACYKKESHKIKMIYSLIGTGLVVFTYLYLTTKTKELNGGNGAIICFFSYFFMLYASSGIKKLPFLGTILGALNAIALYLLKIYPITSDAQIYGWDTDIAMKFELLIVITFLISIILQFISVLQWNQGQDNQLIKDKQ